MPRLNNDVKKTIIQLIHEKKPESVEQLVSLIKKKTSTPENVIIESIIKLQNEGKIKLEKPFRPLSQNLVSYLKTQEALWYWITMALAIATAISAFTIPEDAIPIVYIRYILGAIFVIYLPGYSFIKALFPTEPPLKTSSKGLDIIERAVLSLAMSLAFIPTFGIVLNYTQWGIRLTPILLSLLAFTTISSTIAVTREHQIKHKISKNIIQLHNKAFHN